MLKSIFLRISICLQKLGRKQLFLKQIVLHYIIFMLHPTQASESENSVTYQLIWIG